MNRAKRWLPYIDELIVAADEGGSSNREALRWLNGLGDRLYGKLVDSGLAQPRAAVTLKAFIDRYIAHSDLEESTKIVWRRARKHLVKCFGPDKPLREFTAGDAKDFRQFLLRQSGHGPKDENGKRARMAESTVRKMCAFAKQFLEDAAESGVDRSQSVQTPRRSHRQHGEQRTPVLREPRGRG
ncbi:MAG: phage integrase SAM-like domain-containing protein [Planctomycetaceae bacterium]